MSPPATDRPTKNPAAIPAAALPLLVPLQTAGNPVANLIYGFINTVALGLVNMFADLFLGLIATFLFFPAPAKIGGLAGLWQKSLFLFFGIWSLTTLLMILGYEIFPASPKFDLYNYFNRSFAAIIAIIIGQPALNITIEATHQLGQYIYPQSFGIAFMGGTILDLVSAGTGTFLAYFVALIVLYQVTISVLALLLAMLAIRAIIIYTVYAFFPLFVAMWLLDFGPFQYSKQLAGLGFKAMAILLGIGIIASSFFAAGAAIAGDTGTPSTEVDGPDADNQQTIEQLSGPDPSASATHNGERHGMALKLMAFFGTLFGGIAVIGSSMGMLVSITGNSPGPPGGYNSGGGGGGGGSVASASATGAGGSGGGGGDGGGVSGGGPGVLGPGSEAANSGTSTGGSVLSAGKNFAKSLDQTAQTVANAGNQSVLNTAKGAYGKARSAGSEAKHQFSDITNLGNTEGWSEGMGSGNGTPDGTHTPEKDAAKDAVKGGGDLDGSTPSEPSANGPDDHGHIPVTDDEVAAARGAENTDTNSEATTGDDTSLEDAGFTTGDQMPRDDFEGTPFVAGEDHEAWKNRKNVGPEDHGEMPPTNDEVAAGRGAPDLENPEYSGAGAGTSDEFNPDDHPGTGILSANTDVPDHLDPSDATEVEVIGGGRHAANEGLKIAKRSDGSAVFIKHPDKDEFLPEGENGQEKGINAVLHAEASQMLGGHTPDTHYDFENNVVATEHIDGKTLDAYIHGDASLDNLDVEATKREIVTSLAVGNGDYAAENVIIAQDGAPVTADMDMYGMSINGKDFNSFTTESAEQAVQDYAELSNIEVTDQDLERFGVESGQKQLARRMKARKKLEEEIESVARNVDLERFVERQQDRIEEELPFDPGSKNLNSRQEDALKHAQESIVQSAENLQAVQQKRSVLHYDDVAK